MPPSPLDSDTLDMLRTAVDKLGGIPAAAARWGIFVGTLTKACAGRAVQMGTAVRIRLALNAHDTLPPPAMTGTEG